MATLGKFEVGQEVRLKNRKGYGGEREGFVVEVAVYPTGTRVRVLWAKRNGVAAKRTWMDAKKLVQVVRAGADPFPEEDGLPSIAFTAATTPRA